MLIRQYLPGALPAAALLLSARPTVVAAQTLPAPLDRVPLAWLAAGVAVVLALTGAVLIWRHRAAASDPEKAELPPLLFPAAPADRPRNVRPAPVAGAAGSPSGPPPRQYVPGVVGPVNGAEAPGAAAVASAGAVQAPAAVPVGAVVQDTGELVNGTTIRFHAPPEGTLQILPGRLDVVEGADRGQAIRFVRTGTPVEVTFGRAEGPPYRHVQLCAQTVSRQHASMRFEGGAWSIANLSRTNPVLLNGGELDVDEEHRPLREGDRIEMGEVAFVFRES